MGKLYWEEIEEVFIYKLANQKNLGIQVSNPDQVLERVGKVNRMMIKANKRIATANIAQTNVSVPLEEVFEIIEEKLKLRNAEGKGEGGRQRLTCRSSTRSCAGLEKSKNVT